MKFSVKYASGVFKGYIFFYNFFLCVITLKCEVLKLIIYSLNIQNNSDFDIFIKSPLTLHSFIEIL